MGLFDRDLPSLRKAFVMARALVSFIHNQFEFSEGDEVPDDHPMVGLAPHLFAEIPSPSFSPPDPSTKTKPKKPTAL
jgi:hypothetical protein